MNNTNTKGIRRLVMLSTIAGVVCMGMIAAFVSATSTDHSSATSPVSPEHGSRQTKLRSGHSDYLRRLTTSALREGFGKDGVLLLAPQRGQGRDIVARRLRELSSSANGRLGRRLNLTGLQPAKADVSHLALIGTNGYVKVYGDGTKFVIRGDIDNPEEIRRARSRGRIQKDELERLGRNYIRDALADFVKLGNEESLTFLGVKYLRDGYENEAGGKLDEEVVANVAVFGREVRGVPVIGSGSKVAVWFANDREPVGLDVDWPVYQVLRTRQVVLPRERLNDRVRATTVPVTGSDQAYVSRFECGYVDLGGRKRGTQLQSGCSIHYDGRHKDGTAWARIEFVPAGQTVVSDAKWPLARLIAAGRTINTHTPEFARYVSTRVSPKLDASPTRPTGRQPISRPPR
jgi:hypothetical protein